MLHLRYSCKDATSSSTPQKKGGNLRRSSKGNGPVFQLVGGELGRLERGGRGENVRFVQSKRTDQWEGRSVSPLFWTGLYGTSRGLERRKPCPPRKKQSSINSRPGEEPLLPERLLRPWRDRLGGRTSSGSENIKGLV